MELLQGLAVRFYRGVGDERQFFGPLSKMNILIGENNSGKSTFLDLPLFLSSKQYNDNRNVTIKETHRYQGKATGETEFFMGYDRAMLETVTERMIGQHHSETDKMSMRRHREKLFEALSIKDMIWINLADAQGHRILNSDGNDRFMQEPFTRSEWHTFWSIMTNHAGADIPTWINESLNVISSRLIEAPVTPPIVKIPTKRVIKNTQEKYNWPVSGIIDGDGFVSAIHKLQNPASGPERGIMRTKFLQLNKFISEIVGKETKLEVTSEKEELIVSINGKELGLEDLGTGVHEVVLIATICIYYDDAIICIEEPELHLHPALQRKLVRFLQEKTSNQYILSTHSAVFIDIPGASVFHVTNDGSDTCIKLCIKKDDRRDILDSLGTLASDILQANVVVWVEGPSDRILIQKWLSQVAPELIQGLHYTMMFYGGALVAHLSTSDVAVEKFIKLQDLNRNLAIILDSDRDCSSARLKKHVDRISRELESRNGFVWITKGREIENYLDGAKVQGALKEIHRDIYHSAAPVGSYDHAFYFYRKRRKKTPEENEDTLFKAADKVGLAQRLAESELDLGILDLRKKIEGLAEYIRKANGLQMIG